MLSCFFVTSSLLSASPTDAQGLVDRQLMQKQLKEINAKIKWAEQKALARQERDTGGRLSEAWHVYTCGLKSHHCLSPKKTHGRGRYMNTLPFLVPGNVGLNKSKCFCFPTREDQKAQGHGFKTHNPQNHTSL